MESLTKGQQELCKRIGFHGQISELSRNTRTIGRLFDDHQRMQRMVDTAKADFREIVRLNDDDILKVVGAYDAVQGQPDYFKMSIATAVRRECQKAASGFTINDLKKWYSLLAAGMQLAFETYGDTAQSEKFGIEYRPGYAQYVPPAWVAEQFNLPVQEHHDIIWVSPDSFLLLGVFDKALQSFKKSDFTPEEMRVFMGFEETYHAHQFHDKHLFDKILTEARKLNSAHPEFALFTHIGAGYTKEAARIHHLTSPLELDAANAIDLNAKKIKQAAANVINIGQVR
jgi:hypothetical protein